MYLTCNLDNKINKFHYLQLAFNGVKSRKLIDKLENAEQLKKFEVTFDELERMYNEIGYDIVRKRGSHASIQLADNIIINIVIPHEDKYVKISDLKRFLLIKEGKFSEAAKMRY